MVGLSVHGLLGIDAQLAQSAVAARQQQPATYHIVRDCHPPAPVFHQRI
jgi:hypothetical protein